jgi:K+/H+ antiporter YhaU regulatory subunit KhtT
MDRVERVASHVPGLREARLGPGSSWAGRTIGQAKVRERLGVTVLAVSRAGRSVLSPDPGFQLFPGDRLILAGEPEGVERAVDELSRFEPGDAVDEPHAFTVAEVAVERAAGWHGQTLAELDLRNRFGVTVVSIHRPDGQVLVPAAGYVLRHDDRLLVAGAAPELERLRAVGAGPEEAPARDGDAS